MRPLGYNIDLDLLKKLHNESGIANVKRNELRKLIWQKIANEYNSVKGLADPLPYKVLSTKYYKVKAKSRKSFKTLHERSHRAQNESDSSTKFKREHGTAIDNDSEWELTGMKAHNDPLSDTDFELHDLFQNRLDQGNDDAGAAGTRKFVLDSRRKIVALELETATLTKERMTAARDKMEAENFTAQLRRNMAIAEYNKALGKDVPLLPLPGCHEETMDEAKMCDEFK